jgi:hypothetical protein
VLQEAEMVERKDTPKRYIIRITTEANLGLPEISGYNLKGRYVGLRFRGASVTNPDVQKDAPINVPGVGLVGTGVRGHGILRRRQRGTRTSATEGAGAGIGVGRS